MSETHWHLKCCELFQRLTPDQLRRLESQSRSKSFPAKSLVYLPSDDARSVFLLTSGRARIYHLNADGREMVLSFIEPGELFGELALIDPSTRDEYVETMKASTIVMIPVEQLRPLMEEQPTFSLGVTKLIGFRRRRIERRLKNLLFRSNRERLVHLLLDLAEEYGIQNGKEIDIGIRLSHQDLANVIGSTRETVTITLGQLRDERLLQISRQRVVLTQVDRLAEGVDRKQPQIRPCR